MSTFEYLLILAGVILGLAISDLALSTHRLLSAGKRVTWDWLAPMAAVLAFERTLAQWWTWYGASQAAQYLTFGMYFLVLLSAALLFLMAATTLPDEIEEEIDLRVWYGKVYRRLWLFAAAHFFLANIISIWVALRLGNARVVLVSPFYIIPVAQVALAFLPDRRVQFAGTLGFMILYAWLYFGRTLA